jgi:hypothetical protein
MNDCPLLFGFYKMGHTELQHRIIPEQWITGKQLYPNCALNHNFVFLRPAHVRTPLFLPEVIEKPWEKTSLSTKEVILKYQFFLDIP